MRSGLSGNSTVDFSFPPSFTARQAFLRCAVCGELVCHEKTAVEFHLGSLHGLTLAQYAERFIRQ
jgi:hypothetical protein